MFCVSSCTRLGDFVFSVFHCGRRGGGGGEGGGGGGVGGGWGGGDICFLLLRRLSPSSRCHREGKRKRRKKILSGLCPCLPLCLPPFIPPSSLHHRGDGQGHHVISLFLPDAALARLRDCSHLSLLRGAPAAGLTSLRLSFTLPALLEPSGGGGVKIALINIACFDRFNINVKIVTRQLLMWRCPLRAPPCPAPEIGH